MQLDLHRFAKTGRAAPAALPRKQVHPPSPEGTVGADQRPTSTRLTCDVCGAARTRDERHRLVWEGAPATEVVLAELCRDCAAFPDALLARLGGRGRDAIGLVHEIRVSPERKAQPGVFGYAARGMLYLLIAVATFVLVTLATSGPW